MNKKILIVEDDAICIEVLCVYLSHLTYELVFVDTLQKARECLTTEPQNYLALLLDRDLPDGDGLSLIKELNANPTFKAFPIIIVSGATQREQILEGIMAGAYYYLTKPIDKDLLKSVVRAALYDRKQYLSLCKSLDAAMASMTLLKEGYFIIRTFEESRCLATSIAYSCPEREDVVLGLSELMINSIEHGNLGINYREKTKLVNSNTWLEEVNTRLSSEQYMQKRTTVNFRRCNELIEVTISDQGAGFDWQQYMEIDPGRASHSHGRGIALANMLSFADIQYNNTGNSVTCLIDLLSDYSL